MKTIVLYIATVHIAVLLTQPVFGQKNKKNDWYEENLKGKVVQITSKTYNANLKFGEIATVKQNQKYGSMKTDL